MSDNAPTPAPGPPKKNRVWIPLVLIGTLVAYILIGRTQLENRPGEIPTVGSTSEYQQFLNRAHDLDKVAVALALEGKPVPASYIPGLKEAANIYLGLSAYRNQDPGPIISAGQAYFAIAENVDDEKEKTKAYEDAKRQFNEALTYLPEDSKNTTVRTLTGHVHYLLSRIAFAFGLYDDAITQAKYALDEDSHNPDYLWARAAAMAQQANEFQAGRDPGKIEASALIQIDTLRAKAAADLKNALLSDPNHSRSRALLGLVEEADH